MATTKTVFLCSAAVLFSVVTGAFSGQSRLVQRIHGNASTPYMPVLWAMLSIALFTVQAVH